MKEINDESTKMNSYFEEILRQISTHSAIISGFAFAGLTMDSGTATNFAKYGFLISISIAMGFEILALFISGFLLSALKLDSSTNIKWKNHFHFSWWLYLLGLISLLTSLPFMVYLKLPKLFYPALVFTLLIIFLVFKQLRTIIKKSEVRKRTVLRNGEVIRK